MTVALYLSALAGLALANASGATLPVGCSEVPPFTVSFALNDLGEIDGPVNAGGAENSPVDHVREAAQAAIAQVRAAPHGKAGVGVHARTIRMRFPGVSCGGDRTGAPPPAMTAVASGAAARPISPPVVPATASEVALVPATAGALPLTDSRIPPSVQHRQSEPEPPIRNAQSSSAGVATTADKSMGSGSVKLEAYRGADAGRLVVSRVAKAANTMYLVDPPVLCIRRTDNGNWTAFGRDVDAAFNAFDLDMKKIAIGGLLGGAPQPVGAVGMMRLAPGRYELYRTTFSSADCDPRRAMPAFYKPLSFKPVTFLQDYSVPFEIKAGRTLYFGSVSAVVIPGRVGVGLFYTNVPVQMYLTDESTRDLGRARKRWPDIREYDVEVFDADALGSPVLRRAF